MEDLRDPVGWLDGWGDLWVVGVRKEGDSEQGTKRGQFMLTHLEKLVLNFTRWTFRYFLCAAAELSLLHLKEVVEEEQQEVRMWYRRCQLLGTLPGLWIYS